MTDTTAAPVRRGPRALLAALLGASTMTIMASATITPALPGMAEHFAATPHAGVLVRLVLTLPGLAILLSAPVIGRVSVRAGRVRVLAACLVLYVVGGGSGLVLNSLPALLAGRAVLGVGIAGIMATSTAPLADHHPPAEHGRVLGLQGAAMGFGGVVSLLLGGLLASLSWRGPFAVYLLGVPLLVLVLRYVSDVPVATTGRTATTGAWQPRLLGLYALVFLGILVFYVVPTQAPFWLGQIGGAGPALTGAMLAALNLVMTVVGLSFRRLREGRSFRVLAISLFAAYAAGLVVLGLAGSLWVAGLGILVVGLGVGLQNPTFNGWVVASVAPAARTAALGLLTSAMFLAQFLSPLLAQPVIDAVGLGPMFLCSAALGAFVALLLLVAGSRLAQPDRAA
ncbi:Predicted arabinose efflux permease, MFS family [Amycolatopsis sacchari]|uniref:Predicted arabinose efflux permease, MFS family n=1 Tax=Amycolatopsis sacchari TaxID=115433 RepID=A0A1I4CR33_9PSEU|nr:MFS transporter [Amycolatopsis sacchari]SFK82739.1 Predicted arabinose efflux permease, MFS family [Amycolatopsis sacchari]